MRTALLDGRVRASIAAIQNMLNIDLHHNVITKGKLIIIQSGYLWHHGKYNHGYHLQVGKIYLVYCTYTSPHYVFIPYDSVT